jgi:membrane associated rhomboid family serine protease
LSAHNPFRNPRPDRVSYVTYFICSLSAALSLAWWATGGHDNTWGHMTPERIWGGDYGGLLTTTFLHANPMENPVFIMHLIFNLLWIVKLGSVAERVLGRLEFAVFCGVAGLVASGAELAMTGNGSVGLSGIVYALFGLAWAGRRTISAFQLVTDQSTVNYMIGWFFLCVFLTYAGSWGVANFAHGGGLLFGGAVGWLFFANPIPVRYKVAASAALAVLATLTVLSVTYLPWSERWQEWHASAGREAAAATAEEEE